MHPYTLHGQGTGASIQTLRWSSSQSCAQSVEHLDVSNGDPEGIFLLMADRQGPKTSAPAPPLLFVTKRQSATSKRAVVSEYL